MKLYNDFPSNYAQINGLRVHYKVVGKGQPTFVLLHGSFLNAFSWRHVIEPLSRYGMVVVFDRIAFGETERPMLDRQAIAQDDNNPYTPESQADLTIALMDHLAIDQAILVGNSTGGTLAILSALRYPQRVSAMVQVGGMVYSGYPVSEMPAAVKPRLPHSLGAGMVKNIIGRAYNAMLRSFWYQPETMPAEVLEHYRGLLAQPQWNRAVWQLIVATHHLHLDERLANIHIPTLVITGDKDRTVPVEQSIRLATEIPGAGLMVLPECGHLPQEECPCSFLQAMERFLQSRLGITG